MLYFYGFFLEYKYIEIFLKEFIFSFKCKVNLERKKFIS